MIQLALLLAFAAQDPAESPWGIAPSHSASWGIGGWAPAIAQTGIHWMRGFYQAEPDRVLPIAEQNGFQVAGILAWSNKKGQEFTFPSDLLPEWKAYVADTVRKCKGRVRHWEASGQTTCALERTCCESNGTMHSGRGRSVTNRMRSASNHRPP